MANGENHAKRILIDDTLAHVAKLENGSAGDLQVIGRTLSKVAKITCAMYEFNFRTVEDCEGLHKDRNNKSRKEPIKIKIGPIAFEGHMTPALLLALPNILLCFGGGFAIGRWQGWW